MRVFSILLVGLLLLGGCKEDSGEDRQSDRDEERGDREGERGDREGERGEGPDEGGPGWPPPCGEAAPPPPRVNELMSSVVNAFNEKDGAKVAGFFINRMAFESVSDCDPADVVDRVLEGAKHAGERAERDGGAVTFRGFGEGYLCDIKTGEKPAECRAKADVQLYLTKFNWELNGQAEEGEAHFLRVNGVWFFVKL